MAIREHFNWNIIQWLVLLRYLSGYSSIAKIYLKIVERQWVESTKEENKIHKKSMEGSGVVQYLSVMVGFYSL